MYRKGTMALAVAAALGLPHGATAQTQDELRALREQVRQLDKRVQEAEATAQQAAVQASSRPTGENAMNPAVSVILNGIYSNLSQDPNAFRINGFAPTLGEVGPGVRGLSLGESELALAANIDHNFRGTLIASISPEDGIGVEEGYIQTLALSYGFTIKAGRFFSGVGYQNQIHAHAWDFTDAPLANKVFLGNQLNEDGIQLKWVAPSDLYFDLGLELGRGRQFPAGPAGGRNKNGVGSSTLFAHVGGDLGTSTAWQAGVSYLSTSPQDRTFGNLDSSGNPVNTNSFTGNSRLWVLDGILKWAPNQNPTITHFKLQGEYFRRKEDGNLTFDTTGTAQTGGFASVQSGWYLQGVYQFVPMWRVGYRYDRLNSGTTSLSAPLTAADFPILAAYNPTRHTVMVDWSPSEFSRVRLQAASDKSRSDATDNQVFLQYIVSLGAHGAHKF
ncbi:MAG: hypothetical protein E6H70_01625 [Betaproteobacteria bacterium]|nr:MAG: hypothetical protein E6H70_01625 [Betaproteobacteria bacterium]